MATCVDGAIACVKEVDENGRGSVVTYRCILRRWLAGAFISSPDTLLCLVPLAGLTKAQAPALCCHRNDVHRVLAKPYTGAAGFESWI